MSRHLRLLGYALGAVLLVVLVVFAVQAVRAGLALRSMRTEASTMQSQLAAGNVTGARATLQELADSAGTAHGATDGPVWGLGTHLPWVGDDLAAVRTVASVSDSLTRAALPTAVTLSQAIQQGTFRPDDGQYDLPAIKRLAPVLERAGDRIATQDDRMRRVRTDGLLPFVASTVREVQDKVHTVASAGDISARAARILPGMLGEHGRRTYLLVVQNNAELRASGGLPGSFSVLHAVDGKVTMGFQGASEDVGVTEQPVLPLSRSERALYGDTLGTDIRDTNLTPDFPRTASLVKAMWEHNRGGRIDGVVAVDPTAFAAVLRGTGPVQVAAKDQLTANNVVEKLLSKTYQRFQDPEDQNHYFSAAARQTFEAMMSGRGDQQLLLRGLTQAGREHRLLVWSDRRGEQRMISGTAVAGELDGQDRSSPRVGMYLDDATGGKLDYYLRYTANLSAGHCTASGQQSLDASMLLESRLPARWKKLSPWVLGRGDATPPGVMRINLRIYGPVGGRITQVTVDSNSVPVSTNQHKRRQVAVVPVLLQPGQRMLVSATIRTASGQGADPVLEFTPGMGAAPNGVRVPAACV